MLSVEFTYLPQGLSRRLLSPTFGRCDLRGGFVDRRQRITVAQPEEPADRLSVSDLRFLVGKSSELLGRFEQQFLADEPRHLVHASTGIRGQAGEFPVEA